MPSKTSKKKAVAPLPSIPKALIDPFVSGPMSAEAVNAASMAFKMSFPRNFVILSTHSWKTKFRGKLNARYNKK